MFCKECGAELDDKATVCQKCGVAVPNSGGGAAGKASVPNHMVGAILTTIFCCLIGGIFAIVYAAQVNTKLALGDIAGAKASSSIAKNWITANIILGCLGALISVFFSGGWALLLALLSNYLR